MIIGCEDSETSDWCIGGHAGVMHAYLSETLAETLRLRHGGKRYQHGHTKHTPSVVWLNHWNITRSTA
jgi:hypothetical protein